VKNGPVDFQPREPFSPLFGAMKKTSVMPEFQITMEYLGHSTHLVFLSPMWEECLKSDTYQEGQGSTVARCTDGSIYPQAHTALPEWPILDQIPIGQAIILRKPTGTLLVAWPGTTT
jgi:alpha-glucuronidase